MADKTGLQIEIDLLSALERREVVTQGASRPCTPRSSPAICSRNWISGARRGGRSTAPSDLRPGDAVRITAGPFMECAAVVLRLAPGERVEVLLDVLGDQVPARLPRRAVVAAD